MQYNGSGFGLADRRFLFADHQGSIIAHANNSGAALGKLKYDPYGIPGANNLDRFGYTGQAWLKELGLYHYKARMYHSKLGRFLQIDPIGYKDDFNLYTYVRNNPVNVIDPTGQNGFFTLFSRPLPPPIARFPILRQAMEEAGAKYQRSQNLRIATLKRRYVDAWKRQNNSQGESKFPEEVPSRLKLYSLLRKEESRMRDPLGVVSFNLLPRSSSGKVVLILQELP